MCEHFCPRTQKYETLLTSHFSISPNFDLDITHFTFKRPGNITGRKTLLYISIQLRRCCCWPADERYWLYLTGSPPLLYHSLLFRSRPDQIPLFNPSAEMSWPDEARLVLFLRQWFAVPKGENVLWGSRRCIQSKRSNKEKKEGSSVFWLFLRQLKKKKNLDVHDTTLWDLSLFLLDKKNIFCWFKSGLMFSFFTGLLFNV